MTKLFNFFQKISLEIKPGGLPSALLFMCWTAAKKHSIWKENFKEGELADRRRMAPNFKQNPQKGNGMSRLFYGAVHEYID